MPLMKRRNWLCRLCATLLPIFSFDASAQLPFASELSVTHLPAFTRSISVTAQPLSPLSFSRLNDKPKIPLSDMPSWRGILAFTDEKAPTDTVRSVVLLTKELPPEDVSFVWDLLKNTQTFIEGLGMQFGFAQFYFDANKTMADAMPPSVSYIDAIEHLNSTFNVTQIFLKPVYHHEINSLFRFKGGLGFTYTNYQFLDWYDERRSIKAELHKYNRADVLDEAQTSIGLIASLGLFFAASEAMNIGIQADFASDDIGTHTQWLGLLQYHF